MNESTFWDYLRKGMGERWHVQRHTDVIPGIPDVSYGCKGINGWIELKHIKDFPSKSTSRIRIEHLMPEQIEWLFRRDTTGGHTFLFIKIGPRAASMRSRQRPAEYLLFHGSHSRYIKISTLDELRKIAYRHYIDKIEWDDLEESLTREE